MENIDFSKLAAEKKEQLQPGWMKDIVRDRAGKPESSISNYIIYLENDEKYKGRMTFNEYTSQEEYDGHPFDEWTRNHIYVDVEKMFGKCSTKLADIAITEVIGMHRHNPLTEWIKSLKWDGVGRVDRLFIDLLEADDTSLVREMTRKWMIAGIKRSLEPGCKFDNMIILKGGQAPG